MNIPEGWPTDEMCRGLIDFCNVHLDLSPNSWEARQMISSALQAAPTPPAPEVDPVYQYLSYARNEWLGCSKEEMERVQKNGFEIRVLYTRPANDGLRKAAEDAADLLHILDSFDEFDRNDGAAILHNLRAELDKK